MTIWKPNVGVIPIKIPSATPLAISSGSPRKRTNLTTNKKIVIKSAQRLQDTVQKRGQAKVTTEGNVTIVETEPATVESFPKDNKPRVLKKPAKGDKPNKKLSCLAAAVKVLGESTEPLSTKEMIETMETKGYWTSPGGKTPHATLYSAILREISTKGKDARFKKTERGKFAANS